MMAIQKQNCPGEYNVWRPNSGAIQSILLYQDLKLKYTKRDEEAAEKAWRRVHEEVVTFREMWNICSDFKMVFGCARPFVTEHPPGALTVLFCQSKSWDEKNDKGARIITVSLLCGSLIPVWDTIHEVVQRASARGGSGVTNSQAEMKVVRMSAGPRTFIGLRLPQSIIASVKKKLDEHANLLAGKVVQVALEASTLAAIPMIISQHWTNPGKYKGKAYVGAELQSDVVMSIFNGNVMLEFKHQGQPIRHNAPKGANGEFVTHLPFLVPVPIQSGGA